MPIHRNDGTRDCRKLSWFPRRECSRGSEIRCSPCGCLTTTQILLHFRGSVMRRPWGSIVRSTTTTPTSVTTRTAICQKCACHAAAGGSRRHFGYAARSSVTLIRSPPSHTSPGGGDQPLSLLVPAPRGGARRSPQRRPAALQDRPAPTPARQQRSSRCRPPNSPTTRPRRPRPQRLAPAVMIRTLGCLPALIRPPFRCSTVPLQARARNGTTTATLRVIYPATNLGPGRATQHRRHQGHRFVTSSSPPGASPVRGNATAVPRSGVRRSRPRRRARWCRRSPPARPATGRRAAPATGAASSPRGRGNR